MGTGTFSRAAYSSYSASTVGKTTDEIYTSRKIDKSLDPLGVGVRESRDSVDNPNSTPVIVGIDVTGSMGMLADVIAREGLGVLFEGILDRKPITDPHVMFMAIGDANYDSAPLQGGDISPDPALDPNERFTIEVQTPVGATLDITRTLPPELRTVMQLH